MVRAFQKIRVAVIGATGSVGGAVLDICRRFPERFDVVALAAQSNQGKLLDLLVDQHGTYDDIYCIQP